MRLRNIPGSKEAVAESSFTIDEPEQYKGKFSQTFFNGKPVRIEIGMGKGRFITQMAEAHPEVGYIGIEMYSSVIIRGIQKLEELEEPPENLKLLCMDARELTNVFGEGEIDRIYLNFSDPWPRNRHAKRRLTHQRFLNLYHVVLKKGGQVEFKTDNTDLFDFSLQSIEETPGWKIVAVTRDLHNDTVMNQGNIMTEYEEKFSAKGNPICKVIFERE
ncbi:MAG: tRNA (guanosine(46)-N7)-methyltransferase TrmB [bacterium LCO1.1]|uniref:tRNA (guanine-N(7)-)-methyltransferase n=1 Tax=Candidatus Weimeria bifida TaxID=2599074 RepID=A0A6N7J054_9FIRM|nr:tRNA (guanosine(46)-N7)-methyltransferase TrmB [Candidatus Weimeria bifida]